MKDIDDEKRKTKVSTAEVKGGYMFMSRAL